MRKIRASVVERLEKAKLTNKELSIFFTFASIRRKPERYLVFTTRIFVLHLNCLIRLSIPPCIN